MMTNDILMCVGNALQASLLRDIGSSKQSIIRMAGDPSCKDLSACIVVASEKLEALHKDFASLPLEVDKLNALVERSRPLVLEYRKFARQATMPDHSGTLFTRTSAIIVCAYVNVARAGNSNHMWIAVNVRRR